MSSSGLQIHILGELTVFTDGQLVPLPGSRKTRALLAYLLLQDRPVTREHLCEMLWPHPDDPRAALRWSLTKLRPILNADVQHLVADRSSVTIEGLDDRVDLRRIDRLFRKPIEEIATADLESAAAKFHGELLEGMEIPDCHRFNEWLIARGEAARRTRRSILTELSVRLADDPEAALVHARGRVALDPLDESAHVDVVRLLGSLGRMNEAQEQVERCRTILHLEMGVEPGAELSKALQGSKRRTVQGPVPPQPTVCSEPAVTVDAGLFGRAEECARLEAFLTAEVPRPALFLEGEPGIGKSRLLTELQRRAEARDMLVLSGRSCDLEMVRPFGVWIDLLADLPKNLVPENLWSDLAPLMPSLGEPQRRQGELDRLAGAVAGLIEHLGAAGRNLVLVFDDIHWIDQASAGLLAHVSSSAEATAVGLACAGRPGEFADNDSARSLIRRWNRAGTLDRVSVAPLSDRDAAALARSWSTGVEVADIVASCGGNPLYLIESVREGTGRASGRVTSLAVDRLMVLAEPIQAIARWAAVLGRAFPATWMAELLPQSLDDLLTGTEILERHGVLRPDGDEWDFTHDLLRRATLAGISSPRRTLMHRRIAQTLAAAPDPDGVLSGDVAFHAAHGGEPELAARAAVAAGDRALRLAALSDAWRLADRGLREVARLDGEPGIEVQVELLRVLVLASLGRRRVEAIGEQLAQLARRAHEVRLHTAERTALWLLSVVTEEAGDLEAARQHSLGAEAASRDADPRTRLQAMANTARCLVQLEREPDRAGDLLRRAAELSRSLQMPVLDIPWGFGLLYAMEGRQQEARDALEQSAAMARDQDNHWALFESLSRLSMLDLANGDLDGVEGRDGELCDVTRKLGEGSESALAMTLLALARRQAGQGSDELDAALIELRAADSKGLLAYALIEAGKMDLEDGDVEAAIRRSDEALAASSEVRRYHQNDRAMLLRGRAALLEQDLETMDRIDAQLESRLAELNPEVAIGGDLDRLRASIAEFKEKKA